MSNENTSPSKGNSIKNYFIMMLLLIVLSCLSAIYGWLWHDTITTPFINRSIDIEYNKHEKMNYYRAAFDTCFYFGLRSTPTRPREIVRDACNIAVSKMIENDWFETESPDFKWPVQNPTMEQQG